MTNLYLIAHKVRGEPAFDVAVRMVCPICQGEPENDPDETGGCVGCDSLSYWWIVPTSGHRAYPYDDIPLNCISPIWLSELGEIPEGLPDHYPTRASAPRLDITALFKSPAPFMPRIRRRL